MTNLVRALLVYNILVLSILEFATLGGRLLDYANVKRATAP